MKILAIETSCDETAAAVVESREDRIKILSNIVGSQIKLHQPYGGVVPELAARRHAEMVIPVVREALCQAFGIKASAFYKTLKGKFQTKIDAVAVTNNPGLMIALLVGVEAAKSLAYGWNKPLMGVNHLEGHIYSVIGESSVLDFFDSPKLALIVSGGHTMLVVVAKYGQYEVIGNTLDDAAGEAFDKVAKMLGLSYPGGPSVSKAALNGQIDKYDMPRPMLDSGDFNFSFAGIKTHVMYLVEDLKKKNQFNKKVVSDIAASFQDAITDVLLAKTVGAALDHSIKTIAVSGGVAANQLLQKKLKKACEIEKLECVFPVGKLIGDNAAMIGIAGLFKLRYTKKYDDVFSLECDPKWRF